jgi:ribose-phosphate pyrophosphokinase
MPRLEHSEVRFFSGSAHPELAAELTRYLQVPLDPTLVRHFSNDNLYIQLGASVRGRVVYIIQSLVCPTSDHLMELLMMLDIARGAGASQIHAIIPYFSYARSDKKDAPRISITARLIADLLQTAGSTHVMTMTLHSPQVHGFFSVPTDPLTARPLFIRHFHADHLDPKRAIVVAPDVGRAKSAARFALGLGLTSATAAKVRLSDSQVVISDSLERQVRGFRQALIYDDEIATGATVQALIEALLLYGLEELYVICTHGLFTGDSLAALADVPQVRRIVTTNTTPIPRENRPAKLEVLSVAPVFGEAIWRNANRNSIGDLFSYADV